MELPNLAGVATQDLVQQVGGSSYKASYINWARTMQLLRQHAPGWLPELVCVAGTSEVLHKAPNGGYLLIYFRHVDGYTTSSVPQAVMDAKNSSVPFEKIDARDITDTHVRGVCKAAALLFGLAYELWAKMPLESGYRNENEDAALHAVVGDDDETQEEKDAKRLAAHQAAVGKHFDTVASIKHLFSEFSNGQLSDSDTAIAIGEAWYELDQDAQRALWHAPTKGGVFTTEQRDFMKNTVPKYYKPAMEKAA